MILLGEADNGMALVEQVARYQPDIVLTDTMLPGMSGIDACKAIKENYPTICTIALSLQNDRHCVLQMVRAGAMGYLSKISCAAEIIKAIRTVSAGNSYYSSFVSNYLFGQLGTVRTLATEKTAFSKQELSIIKLLCKQLTTKEIAANLGLAKRTIEDYRFNIQEKIGAKNMVGIALYAVCNEIIRWSDI